MRLTYANFTSTLALIVAIGTGGAYAADKITGKDVKPESLKGKHVKNLTGRDIRDGSLTLAELGELPKLKVVPVVGPTGHGDCIEDCPTGRVPVTGVSTFCGPGTTLVGGGAAFGNNATDAALTSSVPHARGGWTASGWLDRTGPTYAAVGPAVVALCASITR